MMNTLREVVAILVFLSAIFLLANLAVTGFTWPALCGAVICFIAAYLIWPSKRKGQRSTDNAFLDLLELLIELPVELILGLLRLIGRLFRGDGVDL